MYSLSLDYIFNRVYDVLLWIKYVWLFGVWRKEPEQYLVDISYRSYDGLRDRGWFNEYFAQKDAAMSPDIQMSLWDRTLNFFGITPRDSDGDGIPDSRDPKNNDPNNLTDAQLKERYEADFTLWDKVRDMFGFAPKDTDQDGVPDSYEKAHGLSPTEPDSDYDGLPDGKELSIGTNPLNNDSDRDLVLDGRDEAPLDAQVSSLGLDTDGDGVSDAMEKKLGTNISAIDTDGDGVSDAMDTYPLDPNNLGGDTLFPGLLPPQVDSSIANPLVSFMSDLLSVMAVFSLIFLVYVIMRWFFTFWTALEHYDHHFGHGDSHGDHHHDDGQGVGIPGLAVGDGVVIQTPLASDFANHPKWAIIQGYMASESEPLWRIGILEADNMLRDVLAEKGYQGADVGEMLQEASFKTVQLAWDAHKMRNRIAHQGSDYVLSHHDAKRTFTLYESVFKELKAIQ